MIGVTFSRILKTAFNNFWRNIWLSVATTMIMTITLLMITFLYFANIFGGEVLNNIEQKVDLSVTFKENIQTEYIKAIAEELEARDDVQEVRIVSSEEALTNFKNRHKDEPLIEETLQELESNPLPASIFIIATEPRFYQNIAGHLEDDKYSPFVDQINFDDSKAIIDRLISLISSIKNISFAVTTIFALLAILIMFNTIRLAIYSFREEIDIMRVVGASRWYIQGPFIIEAIIVALLSITVSNLAVYPVLKGVAPHLQKFFFDVQGNQFNIYTYAVDNWVTVIGLQIVAAVLIAVLSSYIAIRRYLKD